MIDRRCFIAAALANGAVWSAGVSARPTAPMVHRFTQDGPGPVNSYIIEGADALILVDAQRRISAARELVSRVHALRKPVALILITHAHPDHYGGLATLANAWPDATIAASGATAETLAKDARGYTRLASELIGADFAAPPRIDRLVSDGESTEVAGLELRFAIVADTEFDAITTMELARHRMTFASDLVANHMHPFLADADPIAWQDTLALLERSHCADHAYPGHGAPGPAWRLFRDQRAYLAAVLDIVSRIHDEAKTADAAARIKAAAGEMRAAYPGWADVTGRPDILELNAAALLPIVEGGRWSP